MRLRQAILWQPGTAERAGIVLSGAASLATLAYLHLLTGLAYEFHLFFILPVAVVVWFTGLRAGLWMSVAAAVLWFWTDHILGSDRAEVLPLLFNSGMRLAAFFASAFLLAYLRSALERERRLAREDFLTRLPNRHEFHEQGSQTLALAHRAGLPMTAVFIDLDNFKQVNDSAGVASYSKAPAELAAVLSEADDLMYEVKHGGRDRVLQKEMSPPQV